MRAASAANFATALRSLAHHQPLRSARLGQGAVDATFRRTWDKEEYERRARERVEREREERDRELLLGVGAASAAVSSSSSSRDG